MAEGPIVSDLLKQLIDIDARIAFAVQRIDQMKLLLARLRADGTESTAGQDMLEYFEQMLEIFRETRRQTLRKLEWRGEGE